MTSVYLLVSLIALLLFVSQYFLFSYAYLVLIVFCIISLFLYPLYDGVVVGLLFTIILVPILRLLYLFVRELRSSFATMGKQRSWAAISLTLLLWLPFPVLAGLGYWMLEVRDAHVQMSVEDYIYGLSIDAQAYSCGSGFNLVCRCQEYNQSPLESQSLVAHDCPAVDPTYYSIKQHSGEMERDIHSAIERLKAAFREDIIYRIESRLDNAQTTIEKNNSNIEQVLFGNISQIKKPVRKTKNSPVLEYTLAEYHADLEPPECNGVIDQLFKLRDCVKNIALEPLSNAYLDIRDDLHNKTIELTSDSEKSVGEKIKEIKQSVNSIVNKRLGGYSRSAHKGVEQSFTTLKVIDQISFVTWVSIVIYALLTGFIYLYIRYAYNKQHGNVPFTIDEKNNHDRGFKENNGIVDISDITVDDSMNSFSQNLNKKTWYATIDSALRYEIDGIISIPRPLTLIFKRLPNRYFLFRYSEADGKQSIEAHADGLTRFIKIKLKEGQSTCFNFSNLVAFSDDLTLNTIVSLKLKAFFQSQFFFSTASGPGELIVRTTSGKPEIMPAKEIKPSDPRDLVVFDLNGRYSLLADLNPLSVYFLGHRIVPDNSTAVIRQSPDNKSSFSSQATAVRRTLYLLLPLTFITIILPWVLP